MKRNTAVQQARRASQALSPYLWLRLEDEAYRRQLVALGARFEWTDAVPPAFSFGRSGEFTAGRCLRFLLDSRSTNTLLPHEQASLEAAAVEVATAIFRARGKVKPDGVRDIPTTVRELRLDLPRCRQPRYSVLLRNLDLKLPLKLAQQAGAAWCELWWRHGYLSAEEPGRLTSILRLLAELQIKAAELEVRLLNAPEAPETEARLGQQLEQAFVGTFGDPPIVRSYGPGPHWRNKPKAYLVWPEGRSGTSAGSSNAGFDAVMFAVAVWSQRSVQEWACPEST